MKFTSIIISLLLVGTLTINAAEKQDKAQELADKLTASLGGMQLEYIAPSPIPGLYEVLASGQLLYVTEDGNYLINGRLFGIENGIVDLSGETMARIDSLKAPMRKATLDQVPEKDMIIFKAAKEQYTISVFTDVDCGFCRALHRELPKYNDMGITVRYLGFPRAGLNSPSFAKLRSVWCADDQLKAMDDAKIKREFGASTCEHPLEDHMKLVRQFGITGTPAIILESGRLISGFVKDPAEFLDMVKKDHEMLLAKEAHASTNP